MNVGLVHDGGNCSKYQYFWHLEQPKLLPNRRLSLWYTKANENRVSLNHITVYSTTQSWQQKATMHYLKEVTELWVICLVSILVFFFDITEQLQTDARCDYEQWYGEKYQRTQLLTRSKYLQAQASNQYSSEVFNRVSQRASHDALFWNSHDYSMIPNEILTDCFLEFQYNMHIVAIIFTYTVQSG